MRQPGVLITYHSSLITAFGGVYADLFRRELQGEAPAPAEPSESFNRHPADRRQPAALLLELALGAGALRRGLGLSVRRPLDRGQQPGLLPQPRLPRCRPRLARAPRARRRRTRAPVWEARPPGAG